MYLLSIATLLQNQQQPTKLSPQKPPSPEAPRSRSLPGPERNGTKPSWFFMRSESESQSSLTGFQCSSTKISAVFATCEGRQDKRGNRNLNCLKEVWEETVFSQAEKMFHITVLLL